MANANQFLPFATGAGSNVIQPQLWSSDSRRLTGMESGIAKSDACNTVWRQAMFIAAMIAQFTADYGDADVLDDGNLPVLENNFIAALFKVALGNSLLFEGGDVGSANSMHVTSLSPATETLSIGKMLLITKTNATNTGAMIGNVLDVVNKPIHWGDGSELAPGSWDANSTALLFYDGNKFQLLSFIGPSVITSLANGEGIAVSSGLISLAYHSLTEENILSDDDEFTFYQTPLTEGGQAPEHHRKIKWSILRDLILPPPPPNTSGRKVTLLQISGTWTPDPAYNRAVIYVTGGGASGGVGPSGGGGGGATAIKYVSTNGLAAQSVTVGLGGPANANAGNGNDGGTTSVGALCSAEGGKAGTAFLNTPQDHGQAGPGGSVGTGDMVIQGNAGLGISNGYGGANSGGGSFWGGAGRGGDGYLAATPGAVGGGGGGAGLGGSTTSPKGGDGLALIIEDK